MSEIVFERPQKYTKVKDLGEGACGRTVLLHDAGLECDFVAKKFDPSFFSTSGDPELFLEHYERFRKEASILFRANHENIVRVFNFFDYREHKTGYILMEHVDGQNILEYLSIYPQNLSSVFRSVISGFAYLEEKEILHRDVRPQNIMVTNSGIPKVIDFGFGKMRDLSSGSQTKDDEKSISLNWWAAPPSEFEDGIYDVSTEVYFVGKILEEAVLKSGHASFKYKQLLAGMIRQERASRIQTFSELKRAISQEAFGDISFSKDEIATYRSFADALSETLSELDHDAKFSTDLTSATEKLTKLHKACMLEEYIPSPNKLLNVFISGPYKFFNSVEIEVDTVRRFTELLRSLPLEKQEIVLDNITSRLDSVERYSPARGFDDQIPF